MRIILLLSLLLTVTSLVRSQEKTDHTSLTDARKVYGLSKLCSEVKYNFVYYDQLTFDWDSLCLASIPAILATQNAHQYYKELQRICARLGDGHTSVFKFNTSVDDDLISPLPFTTKFFNNRIFVNEVYSNELREKGLDKGAEILEINGKDAYRYGKEDVMPYVSSSTPQWTDHLVFSSFDLTEGRKGDIMTLKYRDVNGKTRTESLDKRKLKWDNESSRELFRFEILPDEVGYLHIRDFMDDEFDDKFDKLYEQIKTTSALIIDIRDNNGGNSWYADYILRHLSEKPFKSSQWSTRMYLPAHASWSYPDEWYLSASEMLYPVKKERYTKPVILLTSSATYSSAEDFTIKFKAMNRGLIIGKPTGGSTGNPIVKILIDGQVGVQICTKKDVGPDGTVFVGVGILPDIENEITLEDFLTGKDNVLEMALEQIKK